MLGGVLGWSGFGEGGGGGVGGGVGDGAGGHGAFGGLELFLGHSAFIAEFAETI